MGSTATTVVVSWATSRLSDEPLGLAKTSCTYRSGLVGSECFGERTDLRGEKKCLGFGLMGTSSPTRRALLLSCGLSRALLRDHWEAESVCGRKVEKLTVLLFATQSLDEMEEATMGNGSRGDGGGDVDEDAADESGGSGLGATDGTSAMAGAVAFVRDEAR